MWCCFHGMNGALVNVAALPVLPGIATLTVAADNNKAGIAAADECGIRWANAGCEVYIVSESDSHRLRRDPPGGTRHTDLRLAKR